MAHSAINLVDTAPMRLLGIQTQFSIGLLFRIFAATSQEQQKNSKRKDGRYSSQVTIMFCSGAFENPPSISRSGIDGVTAPSA